MWSADEFPPIRRFDVVKIEGESRDAPPLLRTAAVDTYSPTLRDGRRLEAEAEAAKVAVAIPATRTEPQTLDDFTLCHPVAIIRDANPRLAFVKLQPNRDSSRARCDAVIH